MTRTLYIMEPRARAYTRETRDGKRRVYIRTRVRGTYTQQGCWPAHFWMTLLRMRYLLSTPQDRPFFPPPVPHLTPFPFPSNWLHASFHAAYSRPDRPLFIIERPILIVPINESTWWSRDKITLGNEASVTHPGVVAFVVCRRAGSRRSYIIQSLNEDETQRNI